MGQRFVISNEHTLKHTLDNIEKIYREKGWAKITYSTARQRSLTQNAALHKFCELLAEADRVEYNQVYEALNRHLGQKFGVHVPWPNKDDQFGS